MSSFRPGKIINQAIGGSEDNSGLGASLMMSIGSELTELDIAGSSSEAARSGKVVWGGLLAWTLNEIEDEGSDIGTTLSESGLWISWSGGLLVSNLEVNKDANGGPNRNPAGRENRSNLAFIADDIERFADRVDDSINNSTALLVFLVCTFWRALR